VIAIGSHTAAVNVLAQQGGGGAILWTGVLAVVIVVGCLGLLHLRRRLLGGNDDAGEGMTLDHIRKLHAQGQLSDEEFATLKSQMIEASRPKERHATVEALKRKSAGSGTSGGAP